jgi:cytochrome c oxidase subunit II
MIPSDGLRARGLLACALACRCMCARAASGALAPAGVQALRIHELWQITLWVCMGVFGAILLALGVALLRARRAAMADERAQARSGHAREPRTRQTVMLATLGSSALLAGLVTADVLTDRSLSRLPVAEPLHIEMTGYQWWWQARYATEGSPSFGVSNELHVPVGRPVVVTLKSVDVIHSFWVPELHGKKDLLPGRTTTIQFRADRAGTWRGECAEFCGLQHALMAFSITADTPEAFAGWLAHQKASAAAPAQPDAVSGQRIFLDSDCARCHTVRGTSAAGTLGPDLTHVASRTTLAAGTLVNEPSQLAAWIVQPQSLKAGATMPPSRLPPEDVRLLVSYLETLQ